MKKNIILIGMPGTGKSSTGKLLSVQTGMTFADSDALIEKKLEASISEIFARFGEEYFRMQESAVLQELSEKKATVISCGGGAVLNEAAFTMLKNSGVVVWLKASPEKIFLRVKDNDSRPLINRQGGAQAIEQIMKKREPLYEKYSDLQFDCDILTPTLATEQIIKRLGL